MTFSTPLTHFLRDPEASRNVGDYLVRWTGRFFDQIAAAGPYDEITAGDLFALTTLDVAVDRRQAEQILGEHRERISDLLAGIPADASIFNPPADFLDEAGAASQLYDLLHQINGFGYARSSKLMAVKRPNLVPIRDAYVENALEATNEHAWWEPWVAAVGADGVDVAIAALRDASNAGDDVSDLRLVDICLWMSVERS